MQLEQYQAPSLVQLRSPNAHMCCASLALESRASSVDYLHLCEQLPATPSAVLNLIKY